MADEVFFYRLSRKFVDEQFDVPEEAREVMYYSLAIGHHLGIVDCLSYGNEYIVIVLLINLVFFKNTYKVFFNHRNIIRYRSNSNHPCFFVRLKYSSTSFL